MAFSQSEADQVCNLITSGLTLRQTADQCGISAALILWNRDRSPEFAEQYARALESRTDQDFEGLVDLAFSEPERGKFGVDNAAVQLRKLQIDTVKWALSKRNPKKYGDRLAIEGNIELGLADRLSKAVKRVEPE